MPSQEEDQKPRIFTILSQLKNPSRLADALEEVYAKRKYRSFRRAKK